MEDNVAMIEFMKSGETFADVFSRQLEVRDGETVDGYLIPLSRFHLQDEALVDLIKDARNANVHLYPTRFEATAASTVRWIEGAILGNDARLIFLICDPKINPVGLAGFVYKGDNEAELDSVQRLTESAPGLMAKAVRCIEKFAFRQFAIERLSLRVLASNDRARQFYRRLGYVDSVIEDLVMTETTTANGQEIQLVARDPKSKDSRVEPNDQWVHMQGGAAVSQEDRNQPILTAGPSIGPREAVMVSVAVKDGWNGHHSRDLQKFESEFAELVGVGHAIATSSCTGALHLALRALEIGPGDEVIVPDITWVATAAAVAYVGATPVFCEVDDKSWTMDVQSLPALVTERTKAVIPVHLYGFPCQMDLLMRFAEERGLAVVEDAAPSVGAEFMERSVGSFGTISCFSFQGAKVLVGGEGGVAVTNDDHLANRIRTLNSHGRIAGTFDIGELGFKYAMSNPTAALVRAQLRSRSRQFEQKRRLRHWYETNLTDTEGLHFQQALPHSTPLHWMISLTVDPELYGVKGRDSLREQLRQANVDTRPTFPTLRKFPMWSGTSSANPKADFIAENGVNLPSGVNLERWQVDFVAEIISDWCRNNRQ